jgi:chromosome segregation ATPase
MDKIDKLQEEIEFLKEDILRLEKDVDFLRTENDMIKSENRDIDSLKTTVLENAEDIEQLRKNVFGWSKKVKDWSNNLSEAVNKEFIGKTKVDKENKSKAERLEKILAKTERENLFLKRELKKVRQEMRDMHEQINNNEHVIKRILSGQ